MPVKLLKPIRPLPAPTGVPIHKPKPVPLQKAEGKTKPKPPPAQNNGEDEKVKHRGGRGNKKPLALPFDPTDYPPVLHINSEEAQEGMKTGAAVYVGRDEQDKKGRGRFGNPFVIGSFHGPRAAVIARHKKWLSSELLYSKSGPERLKDIRENLAGRALVCFCKPEDCHGDFLRLIANCPEKDLLKLLRTFAA